MSTKKVIAIVVLTNLILIALLLVFMSTAGVVMAFPPGPRAEDILEETAAVEGLFTRTPSIPNPNYDSGWVSISKGKKKTFYHRLRGDVDKYLVDVVCKDTTAGGDGINHNFYGIDAGYGGITWWGLTTRVIKVYRENHDPYCEKVRVRIWITGAPIYKGS